MFFSLMASSRVMPRSSGMSFAIRLDALKSSPRFGRCPCGCLGLQVAVGDDLAHELRPCFTRTCSMTSLGDPDRSRHRYRACSPARDSRISRRAVRSGWGRGLMRIAQLMTEPQSRGWTHRDGLILGPVDELCNDEKVGWEAHLDDVSARSRGGPSTSDAHLRRCSEVATSAPRPRTI